MRRDKRAIQTLIFASRWLAAPFFVGLLLGLVLLLYRFFADLYELARQLSTESWHDLVVGELDLVDIALTANLLLIVIFSGYENYIQKIRPDEHPDWPPGLINVDFSALKQKLLGSVAVIAAVDALAWYLNLEDAADPVKLAWAIGFPLMFAVAMVLLALADRFTRHDKDRTE